MFPGIEVVDDEREVSTPMMRVHRKLSPADQMQFLVWTELKPGAGEIERWTLELGQAQYVAVKCHTLVDMRNVDGDMIELADL